MSTEDKIYDTLADLGSAVKTAWVNSEPSKEEIKEEPKFISYEDFLKVDIRSGKVLKAERVPKSKKLLKLEVSFGELGNRTILASIGASYDENLVGCHVLAVVNLPPRTMMGIESNAMILAAESDELDGNICLAHCPFGKDGARLG